MQRHRGWALGLVTAVSLWSEPVRAQFFNHYQTTYDIGGVWHQAVSFKQTADGGYVYVGPLPSPNQQSGTHLVLVKLDPSFAPMWSRAYFLPGEFDGSYPFGLFFDPSDVDQTADGGYIACGRVTAEGFFDGGFILRTDAAGTGVALNVYPGTTILRSCVEVTKTASPLGGVLAVGDASTPAGQAAVLRTDPALNLLWGYAVVGVKNGQAGLASYAKVIHYQKKLFAMTGYANGGLVDQDLMLGTVDAGGVFGLHQIYGETFDPKGNRVFEYGRGLVEVSGNKPGLAVTGGTFGVVPDV